MVPYAWQVLQTDNLSIERITAHSPHPDMHRALLERATHLNLPPRKMKILFKRWLDYEKTHGDDSAVDHVKQRAREFVESVGQ